MRFENAYIPAKGAWTSPFSKWQGSFATLHMVKFAADVTSKGLERAGVAPGDLDSLVFGWTIPAKRVFYGAPWIAGLIGAPQVTGAMISQACATSAAALAHAGAQIDAGGAEATVVITADKCSNGPHLYHPNPAGPGGKGDGEDWVWDNFSFDPWAKGSMIQTAENVAAEAGISREEQDALDAAPLRAVQGRGRQRLPRQAHHDRAVRGQPEWPQGRSRPSSTTRVSSRPPPRASRSSDR